MVSTVVNSKNSIKDFITEEPVITMFGSEANGLCKELLSLSDISYTVPYERGCGIAKFGYSLPELSSMKCINHKIKILLLHILASCSNIKKVARYQFQVA